MSEVSYVATGPSVDHKYGIAAMCLSERRGAVAAPFLKDYKDAIACARVLYGYQVSIDDFCAACLEGSIMQLTEAVDGRRGAEDGAEDG